MKQYDAITKLGKLTITDGKGILKARRKGCANLNGDSVVLDVICSKL